MRALKIILIAGSVLILAAILGAGYILFLRPYTLPVYHLDQQLSGRPNFMATTLALGNRVYISDYSEVPLEIKASWVGKNWMIGRTQDGMDVYAIPGQDGHDYIMLTTEMFPMMIFRDTRIAPVQLSSFAVDEIQVIAPQGLNSGQHQTRDQGIIREVLAMLVNREGIIKGGQAERSANMHLMADGLPGLGYAVYVYMDRQGKVFLAERAAPEDWIPAGTMFTKWLGNLP